MLVAGNDQVGVGGQGASQHLIIVGILFDHPWHLGWRDERRQGAIAHRQCRRRRRAVGGAMR